MVAVSDVVVGLMTENTPRMHAQAIRLVRSIRWFGGAFAPVRIVACSIGELERNARKTLEALGIETRSVMRFHPANPTGNRHQVIAELLDAPEPLRLFLDCDTLVMQDPLPFLDGTTLQGKITPAPTVTDEVFERLFAHFGLTKPPRAHITPFTGERTIPYVNAGVLAMPAPIARELAPVWRKFNVALADEPQLSAPCQRHMHQASLALALAATGVPFEELPWAMNYQLNTTHMDAPPGYAETDPVILHYHHLATDDGFLMPTPYPRAQQRIEQFHERMRAEGFTPQARPSSERESRPVFVLGMHRSGTSVIAQLLHALGIYAGETAELAPPDMFNPTGYWEHTTAAAINRDILHTLGATWTNVLPADVARLSDDQRSDAIARVQEVARSLQAPGAFLLKDPRTSLLFPLWRDAVPNAICVIAWREPMAVARSIQTRDALPLLSSIALWEHYNRTLLRETEGMPRLLVSYEALLADPLRVARDLCDALTSLGIEGLNVPSAERLAQIVNRDFNRSGQDADDDDSLLDADQRALLEGFRSGAVLHERVAPSSPRTRFVLATVGQIETQQKTLASMRERLQVHERLLDETFGSRSWRIGRTITSLLRLPRRHKSVSTEERWRDLPRH